MAALAGAAAVAALALTAGTSPEIAAAKPPCLAPGCPDQATIGVSDHSVRNGQSLFFSGRVIDSGTPGVGALLALQVKQGRRWATFKILRTNTSGVWRSRYRFRRTFGSRRYTFRAHVPVQGGILAPTDSRGVVVRVRGR